MHRHNVKDGGRVRDPVSELLLAAEGGGVHTTWAIFFGVFRLICDNDSFLVSRLRYFFRATFAL